METIMKSGNRYVRVLLLGGNHEHYSGGQSIPANR